MDEKLVKKLILHVGPHKTGTTSLQSHLHAHRDELARQGFGYPSFFPPLPCHNQLALHFAANEGAGGEFLSTALGVIEKSEIGILSGEEFSVPQRPGLKAGLELLNLLYDIQYVFVHRDDVERMTSYILHSLDKLDTSTPGGGIQHILDAYRFSLAQRRFFADRGATMVDYRDFNRMGLSWFTETVIGAHLSHPEKRLNEGRDHANRLLSAPATDRQKMALWLGSSTIADIFSSNESVDTLTLTDAIKTHILDILSDQHAPVA